MSNRVYQNIHTGTIYKKVSLNGTTVAQVTTEAGSVFLVDRKYLRVIAPTPPKSERELE